MDDAGLDVPLGDCWAKLSRLRPCEPAHTIPAWVPTVSDMEWNPGRHRLGVGDLDCQTDSSDSVSADCTGTELAGNTVVV